jgi:hypothetical protein
MFVIHRHIYGDQSDYNPEFLRIRSRYHDDGDMDESFGKWLRSKGAEAITTKPESEIDRTHAVYKVLEIHFPSEQHYLAFKLKYL